MTTPMGKVANSGGRVGEPEGNQSKDLMRTTEANEQGFRL